MLEQIKQFLNLKKNSAKNREIREEMLANVEVNIDNVLILASAILIASIGLNVNSIPVIIGAMLISPIMGPLFTLAYSLITKDQKLLIKALQRLVIYILTAIVISTIYFKLSFIKNPTSEIIARTNPTIFDVLIAIFGGVAGIIGVTRKKSSNVIPGVAIATALMPPLCTIGYGLANANFTYAINASILFLTNAYFIIFTAMVILYFMKLHKVDDINPVNANIIKRATIVIFGIILIVTLLNTETLITKARISGNLDKYIYENINKDDPIISNIGIDYAKERIYLTSVRNLEAKQKEGLKEYISSQRTIKDFEVIMEHQSIEKI